MAWSLGQMRLKPGRAWGKALCLTAARRMVDTIQQPTPGAGAMQGASRWCMQPREAIMLAQYFQALNVQPPPPWWTLWAGVVARGISGLDVAGVTLCLRVLAVHQGRFLNPVSARQRDAASNAAGVSAGAASEAPGAAWHGGVNGVVGGLQQATSSKAPQAAAVQLMKSEGGEGEEDEGDGEPEPSLTEPAAAGRALLKAVLERTLELLHDPSQTWGATACATLVWALSRMGAHLSAPAPTFQGLVSPRAQQLAGRVVAAWWAVSQPHLQAMDPRTLAVTALAVGQLVGPEPRGRLAARTGSKRNLGAPPVTVTAAPVTAAVPPGWREELRRAVTVHYARLDVSQASVVNRALSLLQIEL
uniref:Uncharacterized protein n=1 Tax=Chlamydomonas leiostraca TaxID=1034604 RepID=A0A7S0WSF0_9CHLO